MNSLATYFGILDQEPRLGLILFSFAVLAGFGLFAGKRWGWRASPFAIPIVAVTVLFCVQYSNLEYNGIVQNRSTTWDQVANFLYSVAGGFSASMTATAVGIWIHQRHDPRLHG